MDEIIAERHYDLQLANGDTAMITISISKPFPDPSIQESWHCDVVVSGPSLDRVMQTLGIDPIQALRHAIDQFDMDVRYIEHVYGDKVSWLGQNNLRLDLAPNPPIQSGPEDKPE